LKEPIDGDCLILSAYFRIARSRTTASSDGQIPIADAI